MKNQEIKNLDQLDDFDVYTKKDDYDDYITSLNRMGTLLFGRKKSLDEPQEDEEGQKKLNLNRVVIAKSYA